ncbi:MAG: hypothetical protein A2Y53_06955 [Chloroflexi bacterium RBG_16_47_49]|nr:MAG: hypothetical protein A2Y53_06955 [Chloroflexi bacterium RBG_16_47_49]
MNKHTGKLHKPDYMIYEEAIPSDESTLLFRSVTTLECVESTCRFILRDNEIIEYIRMLECKGHEHD